MEARKILIHQAIKFVGNWNAFYNEIKYCKTKFTPKEIEDIKKQNVQAVTIIDREYPDELKCLSKPPFVLFYKGDLSLLKNRDRKIAIVGARSATAYGLEAVDDLVAGLKPDTIVISGLAKGIDAQAHKSALKNNFKTIAVLGSGIDYCYPKSNENLYNEILDNGGLILSEYPFDTQPDKDYFLERNRIIAALASCILLAESFNQSGALSTTLHGLNLGKNIACIPYLIGRGSNCNRLIKEGAYLIENSEDLNELY